MADRRRRRRRASQDSEDDDESGSASGSGRSASPANKGRVREPEPVVAEASRSEAKSDVESECESEDGVGEAVLSDYDSADPEENLSHSEGGGEEEEEAAAEQYSDGEPPATTIERRAPSADQPTQVGEQEVLVVQGEDGKVQPRRKETKAEEQENLAGERQSGDGQRKVGGAKLTFNPVQESTDDPENNVGGKPGQQLDDDEDRKNPAYIPRKGLFFEHDVRGHTQEEERPKGRNRKLWKDEGRWEHDRFREEEQAPKSREELIAIYGYDIRNGGGPADRAYRPRRPRHTISPTRDKRWRDEGAERQARSWQAGGGPSRGAPPSPVPHSSFLSLPVQRSNNSLCRAPPPRGRGVQHNHLSGPTSPHCRPGDGNAAYQARERQSPRGPPETAEERSVASRVGRRGGSFAATEAVSGKEEAELNCASVQTGRHRSSSPPQQLQPEQRGSAASLLPGPAPSSATAADNPQSSPPAERPVERKSYSLARRTRSRAADLGSKQLSTEESAGAAANVAASSPGSAGEEGWSGGGEGRSQSGMAAGGAALGGLDHDLSSLDLRAQNWNQSPTSYLRSEMRGLPGNIHIPPTAPPQFPAMEEMGIGSSRAKRYSSQRQRAVPEPAPPLHLGVMEGHYYDPMSYQGPIYTHGEGSAPIPPQGMLVQPEMHLPHPGLHPHQSGGPMPNPALYGGPPVPLSPGQPQLLPAAPFYPPPGVMTFPYAAMYPSPQGQSQVTYGGVTYYDTMQQQAQPKPSPPRRTSQPVTVKPPPPEVPYASE